MPTAWIRIRIRLQTAMRAARLFRDAADRIHEERHRETAEARKRVLSELANEHDAGAREIEDEMQRVEEGRDI